MTSSPTHISSNCNDIEQCYDYERRKIELTYGHGDVIYVVGYYLPYQKERSHSQTKNFDHA